MHRTSGQQKRSGSAMCGMSSDGLGVGRDGGRAPANSGSLDATSDEPAGGSILRIRAGQGAHVGPLEA